MLQAILQPEISSLESRVTVLQAQLAAAQQRITLLNEAEFVAGDSLESLKTALQKVSSLAPSAVSNLRAAVLNLFSGDDSTDDFGFGGFQPQPEPQPGSDDGEEQEEVHALPWNELPFDFEKQAVSEPEAIVVEALTGQYTEWACPLACTIEVAAPNSATLEPVCTVPDADEPQQPYIELVPVAVSAWYPLLSFWIVVNE